MAYRTEHTFATPVEIEPGILRLTLPLPTGPRHVHCYFLRGDDGWTLVDTGLGLMETPWDEILGQVDGPVVESDASLTALACGGENIDNGAGRPLIPKPMPEDQRQA